MTVPGVFLFIYVNSNWGLGNAPVLYIIVTPEATGVAIRIFFRFGFHRSTGGLG